MESMMAVEVEDNSTINTDPRIFVNDEVNDDIHNKRRKAFFLVIKRIDGNWQVASINEDPNTNLLARVPKEWAGLTGDDLSKKISEHSIICKYGELGFLEGKLPSDFRTLTDLTVSLFDDRACAKLSIKDAISCESSQLSAIFGSKKSAIRAAEVAADYMITHNKKKRRNR